MNSLVRAAFVAFAFALAGCSGVGPDGKHVGGTCQTDRDCDVKCVTSGKFSGGYCTLSCTVDVQCPDGTACIKESGGMCAVLCSAVGNCADFGRGYLCKDEDRVGDGKVQICRLP